VDEVVLAVEAICQETVTDDGLRFDAESIVGERIRKTANDDASARLAADQLGMQVHATIDVLLRSVQRDLRTPEEVLRLLQQLRQHSTLHIRWDLLLALIAQVRQEFDLV
jgi:predicted nucleic acid-binding protein